MKKTNIHLYPLVLIIYFDLSEKKETGYVTIKSTFKIHFLVDSYSETTYKRK